MSEFTEDRLRSFYLDNPMVMRPAVEILQEVKRLQANGHSSATVVFCATAIELFLKATLLQPIVYGLVLSVGLADVIVEHAVKQPGLDRYRKLLSRMFQALVNLELVKVRRDGTQAVLIDESKAVQDLRNDIIHKGRSCDSGAALHAIEVAVAVYEMVVVPMLWSLGLAVVDKGRIEPRQFT
ncbi:hypothetical protein [Caballeronia sp. dw_276]|uniref:hypothetical protein n=1 Tax=Caballeronia sp. dw_276 TaxID=2719795 RepID=UPI0021023BCE|nr:hypothetical protein [Caballeronia sp. dw_276]